MPLKAELSVEIRAAIVADYKNGITPSEIAKKYKIHRNTVHYQVNKKKRKGCLQTVQGRGGKRKTTRRTDQEIIRTVNINPTITMKNLLNDVNSCKEKHISRTTVIRRLKEHNIKTYVIQRKPYISEKNKKARLKFALEHCNKPIEFWRNILWTDESAFSLNGSYGKHFYRCTSEMKKKMMITEPTMHSDGGKIMIWGCMSYNSVGPLVRLPDKVKQIHYLEILNDVALVAGQRLIHNDFILQHDNAPIHTGRMIKCYLSGVEQSVLQWPAQSPDLNVIENLWHQVKLGIPHKIGKSAEEAWEDIKTVWSQISNEKLINLVDSMPKRLQQVIDAKGGIISY